MYKIKINDEDWRFLDIDSTYEIKNPTEGTYTIKTKTIDSLGRESGEVEKEITYTLGEPDPSGDPEPSPSVSPSASPSVSPSVSPSASPSASPSVQPSASPSPSVKPDTKPEPIIIEKVDPAQTEKPKTTQKLVDDTVSKEPIPYTGKYKLIIGFVGAILLIVINGIIYKKKFKDVK